MFTARPVDDLDSDLRWSWSTIDSLHLFDCSSSSGKTNARRKNTSPEWKHCAIRPSVGVVAAENTRQRERTCCSSVELWRVRQDRKHKSYTFWHLWLAILFHWHVLQSNTRIRYVLPIKFQTNFRVITNDQAQKLLLLFSSMTVLCRPQWPR